MSPECDLQPITERTVLLGVNDVLILAMTLGPIDVDQPHGTLAWFDCEVCRAIRLNRCQLVMRDGRLKMQLPHAPRGTIRPVELGSAMRVLILRAARKAHRILRQEAGKCATAC